MLASILFIGVAPLAIAQDTSKLVSERCTKCHKAARWLDSNGKPLKKTEKQWSALVDQKVRWGASLTPDESALVIEYLTALSSGSIKQPTTTVAKPGSTKAVANHSSNAAWGETPSQSSVAIAASQTSGSTSSSTVANTSVSTPGEQAYTGVEMIWYLLGGGMLIGSGLSLRNKDKQLEE